MLGRLTSRLARGARMARMTAALTIRSVRDDTRLLRTHLFRLFLLLFVGWMLFSVQWESRWLGAPGLAFFQRIAWLNFVFITLGGIAYFPPAITEEKEERTLGLLRMADVGPLALVLGKSIPRLFGALLLVSIQFPFTLLAITLGGVTTGQVTAAYGTLLSYTLLLANLGLFTSVLCRQTSTAAFSTAIVVVVFLFAPWWLLTKAGLVYTGPIGLAVEQGLEWLYGASPVYRLSRVMTTGFAGRVFGFQATTHTLAAGGLFLLSWGTFDLFNRDDKPAGPARGLVLKSAAQLRRVGGGRAWRFALVWKDFHFLAGGPLTLLVKFLVYGLLAVGLAASMPTLSPWRGGSREEFGAWLMGVMLVAFVAESAVLAARVFQQEVKWNTLAGVMMLPTSVAAVAYAKVAGAAFGLIPSATWIAIGAVIAPENLGEIVKELDRDPDGWFGIAWCVIYYLLLLHLAAYLSLFIKWAALPVAFGVLVLTNWCCLWGMAEGGNASVKSAFGMMCFLGVVCMVVLHGAIGYRLTELAARG